MHQYVEKDLDVYMKRFHEKALDCRDQVIEDVKIDVCQYGVIKDYRIYLENLYFLFFFSWLMEAAR